MCVCSLFVCFLFLVVCLFGGFGVLVCFFFKEKILNLPNQRHIGKGKKNTISTVTVRRVLHQA